jgi:hypothetical protein
MAYRINSISDGSSVTVAIAGEVGPLLRECWMFNTEGRGRGVAPSQVELV